MSVTFNNSSSQLASSASLLQAAGGYPISMFCWVKPTTTTPNKFVMAAGTTSEELAIYATPTNMRAWTFARGAGSAGPDSTTSCQTSWQPALAVFTSSTSCTIYYAAGAAVTVNPAVGDALVFGSTSRFYVGRRAHASDYFFGGDIAEVALWSSALTQGNFDSLAAGDAPETVASGSIIDVWSLETDGSTQTGLVNSTVLTATSTAQGSTHPITRSGGGGSAPKRSLLLGVG